MAREGARPAHDPAGHDAALRAALQDVRTGRWMSMRDLLADTTQWWQWTRRPQVLAAAAAGTDVVRAWLAEEPDGSGRPAAWPAGAGIPSGGLPWGTGAHETPTRGVRL